MYGVGARLDETPTLFFRLRGIDTAELIGKTVSTKAENLLEKATQKSSRVIDDADLSALFGINVSTSGEPADRPVDEGGAKRTVKRKAQEKKVTAKKTISRKNTKPPVNDEKSIRAAKSVKRKAVVKGTKRKKRPRALPTKLLS